MKWLSFITRHEETSASRISKWQPFCFKYIYSFCEKKIRYDINSYIPMSMIPSINGKKFVETFFILKEFWCNSKKQDVVKALYIFK